MSQRNAESIKIRVERLVSAQISGHPVDDDTNRWLMKLEETLYEKLANVGLVDHRQSATFLDFVDDYVEMRVDVKPSTATVWNRTRNHLERFFGHEQELRTLTVAQARDFRRYLKGRKLAEDTVRRTCGIAKQFLTDAVERGLINRNPFQHRDIPTATGGGDKSREFFIKRELAETVLDKLPCEQWKTMFALGRFGGLRCPSEVLSLRWEDIDWLNERIVVTSPKTEHHVGGESRVIPLFPELRPYLQESHASRDEDCEFVISKYRKFDSNYGTLLIKKIQQAGLKPWAKPWQNLRSSRETELTEQFPLHVVCSWIGNSQVVAQKHYLQVTDDHFSKAVQNPVQQNAESSCEESQELSDESRKTNDSPSVADDCENLRAILVGGIGLEPTTSTMSTWGCGPQGASKPQQKPV